MCFASCDVLTKKQIEARVRHWRIKLGLQAWDLKVHLASIGGHSADCSCNPEYMEATLRFDPIKISPKDLDCYVVHELLHIYVWPLAHVAETLAGKDDKLLEWVRTQEEALVTHLERLILRS